MGVIKSYFIEHTSYMHWMSFDIYTYTRMTWNVSLFFSTQPIFFYLATNILLPCLFFLHSSLLTFIHPNQVWWSRFEYFTSGLLAVQSAVSLLALWRLWWCTTSCYKQESMLLASNVGVFHSVKKFTFHCHPENEKKRLRQMKICKNKVSAELKKKKTEILLLECHEKHGKVLYAHEKKVWISLVFCSIHRH